MKNELREILARPFGKVLSPQESNKIIEGKKGILIVVGDKSICNLAKNSIAQDICVYDTICMREKISKKELECINRVCANKNKIKVKNPPSKVTPQLIDALKTAIKNKEGAIEINGEDDLASLVAFCYSPIGTIVAYGQPNEGIVLVKITKEKKEQAKILLKKVLGK